MNIDKQLLTTIGQGIRNERKRSGLSQKELALAAGVHTNFIGLLERGEQAATVITMSKICLVLGIGMGDFFQNLNL
ncbi:helix-turn-helix transcriptional regulator [Paenibacillus pabuli]|uniref:helix-turn-helix domain-containing protein n=1 Tax=Paenibacillus pabuli TaxID=1472 RepID=UPI003459C74F